MDVIKSVIHPSEFVALLKFKYSLPSLQYDSMNPNTKWCYKKLSQTSRSFTIVIQKLHVELRDPVMIFYLTLRALDTIEDDMSFPTDKKINMLKHFHEFLYQPGWTFEGCGEGNEKELLQNFDKLIDVFSTLKESYQKIIADITLRMGYGMAEYVEKTVDSIDDWNKYCHYVAGLVGIGLSNLFYASELENDWFKIYSEEYANSMGLFLQKTNIIRDYREDIMETRIFWPKEIWSMYTKKLDNFKEIEYAESAVQCLNHLITNALEHIPHVLEYLKHIKEPSIFLFCAIPQVMAIATLARCFNNHDVFMGIVKIRRGETAKIFTSITDITSIYILFYEFICQIEKKIDHSDPNADRTLQIVNKIKELCGNIKLNDSIINATTLTIGATVTLSSIYACYYIYGTGRIKS